MRVAVLHPMRPRCSIAGAWSNASGSAPSSPRASSLLNVCHLSKRVTRRGMIKTDRAASADDSGSVVGSYEWEEGVLEETGGDILLLHVRSLHLARTALSDQGYSTRTSAAYSRNQQRSMAQFCAAGVMSSACTQTASDPASPSRRARLCPRMSSSVAMGATFRPTISGGSCSTLSARKLRSGRLGCSFSSESLFAPALRRRLMGSASVLLPEAALNGLKDKELLAQLRQTVSLPGAARPACSQVLARTTG